jgi:hypothetical protein
LSILSCLLRNEILGATIENIKGQCDERRAMMPLEGMRLFQVHLPYIHGYQTTATTIIVTTTK